METLCHPHSRPRPPVFGSWRLLLTVAAAAVAVATPAGAEPRSSAGDGPDSHLDIRPDGSYTFQYDTQDATRHRHVARAGTGGMPAVGEYLEVEPAAPHRTRATQYTAGVNGFRAKGPHIARKMSLSQVPIPYVPPVHPDSPNYKPSYSGYRDPNNDPTYSFGFKTSQQARREQSDNRGTVRGAYEYRDDVGELHRVEYTAGKDTGFIVHNEVPDSRDNIGPLFAVAPGRPGSRARGRSAVRVRPDGSFDFTAAGPNMRHQEVSDARGFRRGSYSYVDDRGMQRTVEYEAGPNIGFKVINSHKGPSAFPHIPGTYYPSLYPSKGTTPRPSPHDDLFGFSGSFNPSESGSGGKPPKKPGRPSSDESIENTSFGDDGPWAGGGGDGSSGGKKPTYGSGGGSSASGVGGGGDAGSDSGEDEFLVTLGENHDMYGPRPTGGYGSAGASGPDSKPGGGFSSPDDASGGSSGTVSGASSGSHDEDTYFGKAPYGSAGGGTRPPPHSGGSFSTEDMFDPTPPAFGRPSGASSLDESVVTGGSSGSGSSGGVGDFLSGAAAGGRPALGSGNADRPSGSDSVFKVPYKKCCKLRRRNRKPGAVVVEGEGGGGSKGSSRRDSLVRLPPVRSHVQNIDVTPFGRRVPSPSDALERLGPDSRRTH